jgi:hypothetical protein
MGVIYLFCYILGGLAVALGSSHLLDAIQEAEPILSALKFIGVGTFLIVSGGILQAVVAKRRGNDGLLGIFPPMGITGAAIAASIWLLPLGWAWAQFEMFQNPIDMYPMLSIGGAVVLAFGLGSRVAQSSPMRSAIAMMFVGLVGMPAGILGNALSSSHFNYHLSDVRTTTTNSTTHETETFIDHADDPDFIHEESGIGDETSELLEAFANAKTINLGEEIAAGRMRMLEDGSYVVVNPDGTDAEMGDADDMSGAVDKAFAADEAAAAEKRAKARQEFEAEMEKRRLGGRLFH